MRKVLYALPTTHCNLSCEHCDIKDRKEVYDRDAFIKQLTSFNSRIILFGGEPTLYRDRLFDIIEHDRAANKNIGSISTNLMILNDELISLYREIGHIATSWNPTRFRHNEYITWTENCNWLHAEGLTTSIMITLTDDLISMRPEEFLEIVRSWNPGVIKQIKLEHYVGDTTPDYYHRVDRWLCELYGLWKESDPYCTIFDKVKHWVFDCSGVYTLTPDGVLHQGCPHLMTATTPDECYSCDKCTNCRPCQLHNYCSCPTELQKLVLNKEETK